MLIYSLIPTLFFSLSSFASARPLTLTEAFAEAKKRNETVGLQAEVVKQSEETRRQAIGSILPTVTATYQYTWQKDVKTPTQGSLSPPYNPLGYVTVTQPLFHGFREYSGLQQTRSALRQQETLLENTAVQLFQSLSQTYYSILSLEKDLQNLGDEIKYFNERIAELERFRNIGRAQPTDVLTVQTDRSSLLTKIEQMKGQRLSLRQTLAYQTGLDPDTPLDSNIEPLPVTLQPLAVYLDRVRKRPDVRAGEQAVAASGEAVWVAREGHLPAVDLTYNRYFERAGFLAQVDWDAKLIVSMPLFAGGVTQSKVRQAESVREQERLRLSQSERIALQEIRATYDLVASDLRQIAQAKETVKISEKTFQQRKRDYRLGLVTNLDVLKSLTDFIEAQRTLDTGRFTLKADMAHLRAATAFDLERE